MIWVYYATLLMASILAWKLGLRRLVLRTFGGLVVEVSLLFCLSCLFGLFYIRRLRFGQIWAVEALKGTLELFSILTLVVQRKKAPRAEHA